MKHNFIGAPRTSVRGRGRGRGRARGPRVRGCARGVRGTRVRGVHGFGPRGQHAVPLLREGREDIVLTSPQDSESEDGKLEQCC